MKYIIWYSIHTLFQQTLYIYDLSTSTVLEISRSVTQRHEGKKYIAIYINHGTSTHSENIFCYVLIVLLTVSVRTYKYTMSSYKWQKIARSNLNRFAPLSIKIHTGLSYIE